MLLNSHLVNEILVVPAPTPILSSKEIPWNDDPDPVASIANEPGLAEGITVLPVTGVPDGKVPAPTMVNGLVMEIP